MITLSQLLGTSDVVNDLPTSTETPGETFNNPVTINSASATALTVGANGSTNPVLQVDASTTSVKTGLKIKGAATGGTTALSVIDSGSNASLTLDGKGTGTVGINTVSTTSGLVTIGNATSLAGAAINGPLTSGALTVTSSAASAFAVGPNGSTTPALAIDGSIASAVTGILIQSQAAGSSAIIQATSSGGQANENLILRSKGQATVSLQPGSDGTTAIVLRKAANGSIYFRGDSTNLRIRLGDGNAPTSTLDVGGDVTISAHNIITDTTTGMQVGTGATQKLGFYGATPIVQPASPAGNTHTVTAGSTTTVFVNTTFDGSNGSTAYTVGDIVVKLKALGLLAV